MSLDVFTLCLWSFVFRILSFRSVDATYVSLQVLEANSMKGAVELLEIRPEQLSSKDLGGEQVQELAFSNVHFFLYSLLNNVFIIHSVKHSVIFKSQAVLINQK